MSEEDKLKERTAIVKDALKWLNSTQINIEPCVYMDAGNVDGADEQQFNEVFRNSEDSTCSVCAKGLLFFTHVMNNNHFSISEYKEDCISVSIYDRLPMFSERQLDLIELAFEGQSFHWARTDFIDDRLVSEAAFSFYSTYPFAEDRLREILNKMLADELCELTF